MFTDFMGGWGSDESIVPKGPDPRKQHQLDKSLLRYGPKAYYLAVPALHTSDISWGTAQRKRKAKEYAKRNRTTISKIVQDHFDELCEDDEG